MVKSFGKATIAQVKGDHLIVESLRDELVIYDRRTNKVHLLDVQAAALWNAAGNGSSLDELARVVGGKTVEQRQAAAHLGVADLERVGLVVTDMETLPRRGLLKTLGTAAAMPLVISILAPTSAAAATTCFTSTGGDQALTVMSLVQGGCGDLCGGAGPSAMCDGNGGFIADGCQDAGTVFNCCSFMSSGGICIP